jgi:hypothetical protein
VGAAVGVSNALRRVDDLVSNGYHPALDGWPPRGAACSARVLGPAGPGFVEHCRAARGDAARLRLARTAPTVHTALHCQRQSAS